MSTGYPAAARPHAVAADLFHVVAANLANAAGGRPEPDDFARATVEAMRNAGCFAAAPHRLSHAPTEAQFVAALGAVPTPPGGWSRRMQAFLDSAQAMAHPGGPAAPLFTHASMIRGVVDVAAWLRDNQASSASILHAAMSGAAVAPHAAVWQAIRQLDACRGVGVALAANLLKDSQVPGLVAVHPNPQAIAAVTAGWFAKPDLHVVRFAAAITRGVPLHAGGRRQSLRVALGCMAAPPAGAGRPATSRVTTATLCLARSNCG